MSSSKTAIATRKAIAPRATTSGGTVRSEAALRRDVLRRCPCCNTEGPRGRLAEHVAADHPQPAGPASGFMVSIAPRFRPILETMRDQTGLSFGALIGALLDVQLRGRNA